MEQRRSSRNTVLKSDAAPDGCDRQCHTKQPLCLSWKKTYIDTHQRVHELWHNMAPQPESQCCRASASWLLDATASPTSWAHPRQVRSAGVWKLPEKHRAAAGCRHMRLATAPALTPGQWPALPAGPTAIFAAAAAPASPANGLAYTSHPTNGQQNPALTSVCSKTA